MDFLNLKQFKFKNKWIAITLYYTGQDIKVADVGMQFYTYESRSLIQNLFFARFANKLNKYRYWGKKLSSKFSIPLDKGIISIN